jgi:hypothetical protein
MNQSKAEQTATERATQPFYYEIRVRGALSKEQWVDWFDDVKVNTSKRETTLRGVLPDHSALYGLLGRLRDLAIPLLAVNVLDAQSRQKLALHSKLYWVTINLAILVVYLLLIGALATLTVALTVSETMHTAQAIALLFAAIGALAYVFSLWSGLKIWRLITVIMMPVSGFTYLIYGMVAQYLPVTIGIAAFLLFLAGGMVFLVRFLRGRATWVREALAGLRSLGDNDQTDAMTDQPQ